MNFISLSSVVTIMSSTYFDALLISIVCAMSGFPPSNLMFFRGIPLEPPLAGITTKILLSLYILKPLAI